MLYTKPKRQKFLMNVIDAFAETLIEYKIQIKAFKKV